MACTNRQFSDGPDPGGPLRRGLSFNLLESYHSNLELSIRKCVQQRKMFPSGARTETLVRRGRRPRRPYRRRRQFGMRKNVIPGRTFQETHVIARRGKDPTWQSASLAMRSIARSRWDRKGNGLPRAFGPRNDRGNCYSLLRMILPEMVLGSSSRNSTIRGYL